ncbi:VOC family protein [Nocardia otitidiscaviarum]|uniref:VOC family protein n=1 Tax=Nocardia otitidiscaviarum TaxID=1823 RepID=UPI0004A6AC46|nr:VOC family protein [Nocardia otitidiscaviarum]MBF6487182.1 VOC family protein [Nocardia otitidiscaviarum]
MTTSEITGLHHVGLVVHDLSDAIDTFRRFGFHIAAPTYPALPPTPGAAPEPVGAGNTHADFPRGFLELLAVTTADGARIPADATLVPLHIPADRLDATRAAIRHTVAGLTERLERFEGAHILIFATADAEKTAARISAEGVAHGGVVVAQRPITTAEGTTPQPISYLEIHDPATKAAILPEGRVGVAEDVPAAVLDAQTGLDHPNGAVGLIECVLCVDDEELDATAARYERCLGIAAHHESSSYGFSLGTHRLTLTTPHAVAARLPGERPRTPALSAYTIEVTDLAAAERLLRDRDVPLRTATTGELFIPAAAACGAAVLIRAATVTV